MFTPVGELGSGGDAVAVAGDGVVRVLTRPSCEIREGQSRKNPYIYTGRGKVARSQVQPATRTSWDRIAYPHLRLQATPACEVRRIHTVGVLQGGMEVLSVR